MYAIVRTGGKQYRVEEGRSVQVDHLPGEEGSTLELSDVLLIGNDGDVTLGAPSIEGARVLTTIEEQGRHKKLIVFKYKAKVRTRKKTGHRQSFTRLSVVEILAPGQAPKAPEKPKRAKKVVEAEEAPPEATAEAGALTKTSEASEAEEKPRRRTIRRPKATEPKATQEKAPKARKADAEAEKPKRPRRKKTEDKE